MVATEQEHHQLERLLNRTPVVGDVHPLLPLALPPSIHVISDDDAVMCEVDDSRSTDSSQLLILSRDPRLKMRFPNVQFNEHPPVDAINRNMHHHFDYAREHLLTNHNVAKAIVADVRSHPSDIVVLMLVDGLGYGDVLMWIPNAVPVFIDGPSITYRLSDDKQRVLPSIGFPSIVGKPTVFSRLNELGYQTALGFTYWEAESNVISDALFEQIPVCRVANFEAMLVEMRSFTFKQPTYIQIVREGLDGLAHSKREVSPVEVAGAITAIRNDIERLIHVLRKQGRSVGLYLISDHGILWKNDHRWNPLELSGSRPRYTTTRPSQDLLQHCERFERDGQAFYAFHYPHLGSRIRADDSGLHGGLSYQESIVPFAKFEVR